MTISATKTITPPKRGGVKLVATKIKDKADAANKTKSSTRKSPARKVSRLSKSAVALAEADLPSKNSVPSTEIISESQQRITSTIYSEQNLKHEPLASQIQKLDSPPPSPEIISHLPPVIEVPKPSAPPDDRIVHLKPPIIVKDLAAKMAIKPFQLISDLMQLKILVSMNQPIEPDIAKKLCEKHGFKLELERRGEHPVKPAESLKDEARGHGITAAPQKTEKLFSRPPVVTIMGHVDHGKTTLLDAIRKTNVAGGEAGGITQHIGAYSVSVPSADKNSPPKLIAFLDTPGHEAFTAMRARGANLTDLVILVVAGNEGLMPQTIEAIHHARAASVPIIVALTKMDLEASQKIKDRVKKQLQEHDLASEDWGGKTITVEVSATKKTGIDQLLEMILLQAEMMELKAERDCPAQGAVVEAQMEAGRGATATVLVRKGILHLGDTLIAGPHWAKVKALIDDKGKMLKEASPSTPVKIVGLSGILLAGAPFQVVKSEIEARLYCEQEQEKLRSQKLEGPKRITLEDLLTASSDNRKVLKVILKVDVQGSSQAITESIAKLPQDKIHVEMIHAAVGPITESDVLLATASKALIVGFQVKVDTTAAEAAKREGVQIQLFRIIYELIDQVREMMAGLLDPEIKLTSVGTSEVKQVFDVSKGGIVAGCLVTQGRIERKGRVRLLRRKNVIFEGAISTLRRFQDDVSEVRTGLECGIRLEGFNEYEPGDVIEAYHVEKISQKL